jgi:hypothetical protein
MNNVVLRSSFVQAHPGDIRFAHVNLGSVVHNIDEMRALLQEKNY